jgi:hypothetical protein
MNFKNISLLALSASIAVAASACNVTVDQGGHTDCYYDIFGNYVCNTYYYNGDGTTDTSRDIITNIAQVEQQKLEAQGKHFADKFSLSLDQGIKIAKTISDFNTIQNRSDSDVADFSNRLYGVNPTDIVSAVGKAQAGDNSQLNSVVNEAAKNFNTTSDNMKNIVKTLHGKMLEQQGIRF